MSHRHNHSGPGIIVGLCSLVALLAAGCGSSSSSSDSSSASGLAVADTVSAVRSEERRVGKECRL